MAGTWLSCTWSSSHLIAILSGFWRSPHIPPCSTFAGGLFCVISKFTYRGVVDHPLTCAAFLPPCQSICTFCRIPPSSWQFWPFFSDGSHDCSCFVLIEALVFFSPPNVVDSRKKIISKVSDRRIDRLSSGESSRCHDLRSCHVLTLVVIVILCCDLTLQINLYCVSVFMAGLYGVPTLMDGLWLSYNPCGCFWPRHL